jgi:hypothetical protein
LSRFDFGRVYGYRLINAAQAVEDLKGELKGKVLPIGNSLLPTSESHARELLKVEPENWVKVLENAAKMAGKKRINALLIQCAASELKPAPVSKPRKATYPERLTYTTDLKVFMEWLANLKNHARLNNLSEIQRLLTKAQSHPAILPLRWI